jgi:SAM-dependent methyltransferase
MTTTSSPTSRLTSRAVALAFPLVGALAAAACSKTPSPEPPATTPRAAVASAAAPLPAASSATPAASAVASATPAAADAAAAESQVPDIEYVPTPQNVVDKMLEVAKVGKDDVLYDLGCGDGRIVVTAAKKFGIKAKGFDVDPQRVAESRENAKKNKVDHLVTIEQKDIFTLDLSEATVVSLYLLPELNVRLIPQLEKLKPGARVVSHDFDMEGVPYEKYWTVMAPDHRPPHKDREHYVYLWKTPIKKVAAKPPAKK